MAYGVERENREAEDRRAEEGASKIVSLWRQRVRGQDKPADGDGRN